MPDANDSQALLRRIAELERANARLLSQAEDVAAANVRAAMQLVELHEARERELQAKNREIERALQAAEAASRQKSQFLANMSHELRTPLSGVIGMAELLQGSALQPAQRDYVDSIVRTTDSFLELINQLLDFSKIEAGRLELERVPVDVWALLEDTAQHLQVGVDGKGLELDFDLDSAVPRRILGDPLRLRQVLQNLASNALKFTASGRIGLCASRTDDPATPLRIEVRDTGCGIEEDVAARLFAPFVQADVSTTRRFGGTGLGLAISRHLVKAMGGQLELRSIAGHGTTFAVALPVEVPPTEAVSVAAIKAGRVAVQAAPAIADRVASHLRFAGWDVVDAAADRPDALVVECRDDGRDELQALRARFGAALPRTVLLVQRTPADGGDAACAYVLPPLRPSVLLRELGEQRPTGPSTLAAMAADVAGLRVLVAEDTPVNRCVVEAHLRRLGCEVHCVEDGAAAVAAVRDGDFDLVLMDCHMPILDGYAATQAIRDEEARSGRRTPIVALTANAITGHREQCLAVGMDEQLDKPVRRDALVAALRRFGRDRTGRRFAAGDLS
ncbi:MAG: ATP-binding protein [Planctomycetota bacterium]